MYVYVPKLYSMGHKVDKLSTGAENHTVRVDTWNAAERHWVYYFRSSDPDGEYELSATTATPYEGDQIGTEFGIEAAEEKMRIEDYDVVPHEG